MFKNVGIEPGALPNGFVPVDIDVSPFDNSKTKKEGASRTYKGMDGYGASFSLDYSGVMLYHIGKVWLETMDRDRG